MDGVVRYTCLPSKTTCMDTASLSSLLFLPLPLYCLHHSFSFCRFLCLEILLSFEDLLAFLLQHPPAQNRLHTVQACAPFLALLAAATESNPNAACNHHGWHPSPHYHQLIQGLMNTLAGHHPTQFEDIWLHPAPDNVHRLETQPCRRHPRNRRP